MSFDLGGLLEQYLGRGADQPATEASEHYQQVADNASPAVVSEGLAAAMRSDSTPPFDQIVGRLFGHANPEQRAGMLNRLLTALGPSALAALTRSGVLGALGGASATVSPQQASQLSPAQVQEIARHAQEHDPGIVDRLSEFAAQHSSLAKALGSAALTLALAKIAERARH